MADETSFSVDGVATVRWDREREIVVVEWQGWANTAEFKALLDAEIETLHKHKGSRMLADCRLQRALTAGDQERANDDWIPRSIAAGLKRFAVVLPESARAAADLRARLTQVPSGSMKIAYFSSVDTATEWLLRQ